MWALILHGGAKEVEPEKEEANRRGCLNALKAGQAVLMSEGSAVDAVEAAIRILEADPTFNAGYGSALHANGQVEMCSAVMEGENFNVGAVAVIKGVRHPVSVAKAMLFDEPIFMAADGARQYAEQKGLELCNPEDLISPEKKKEAHDTVGCVALDIHGHIAVGTSTGGLDGAPPGRVGDSPDPGCGYYADDKIGAVAFSGDGEHIARKMLAARVIHSLGGDPDAALYNALKEVEQIDGEAGGIVVTPSGQFGWAHNSREFPVAMIKESDPVGRFYLRKREEQKEQPAVQAAKRAAQG